MNVSRTVCTDGACSNTGGADGADGVGGAAATVGTGAGGEGSGAAEATLAASSAAGAGIAGGGCDANGTGLCRREEAIAGQLHDDVEQSAHDESSEVTQKPECSWSLWQRQRAAHGRFAWMTPCKAWVSVGSRPRGQSRPELPITVGALAFKDRYQATVRVTARVQDGARTLPASTGAHLATSTTLALLVHLCCRHFPSTSQPSQIMLQYCRLRLNSHLDSEARELRLRVRQLLLVAHHL